MNKLISLLVCLAFTGTASAGTIFSCDLSNKYNVSIDSSNQLGLAYDYGKIDATKSDLTLDNKSASYGTYLGPSWSYQYFRFVRGDYFYVVYDRDGRTQGLAVYQGKKLLMNKKCTGNIEHDETGYTAASNQIKHDPDDNVLDFMPEDTSPPSNSPSSSQDQQQETQNQQPSQPSSQSPVQVQIGESQDSYGTTFRTVDVTSTMDNLVINNVMVNRGHCASTINNPKNPYKLLFGKTKRYKYILQSISMITSCNVIEIIVKTNQGDWTFKPNQ